MIARNHELTGFALTTCVAVAAGASPTGSLALGLVGLVLADLPDIDSPRARVTNALRWVPYWIDFPVDKKTGEYKRRKVKRKVYRWWQLLLWRLGLLKRKPKKQPVETTRLVYSVRYFPSRLVHRSLCGLSAWIWDRCATPADRKDTVGSWGPAFRVHRGFCHSVWFAGMIGALGWWGTSYADQDTLAVLLGAHALAQPSVLLGGAMTVGMLTHLAGDCCTDFGLSPFAPVLKLGGRRYPRLALLPEPMRFKVNKWVELKVISPICAALAIAGAVAAFSGPVGLVEALGTFLGSLWQGLA